MAVPLAALAAVLALRCHLAGAQQEGSSPDLGAVKSFQDFDEFRMAQVAAAQDRPKHPGGFGHPDSSQMIKVVIGSSLSENQKCVTPPGPVDCPKDLMLKDHTGQYPDEFHIFHHGEQICARRTDATAGWGMNVAVLCLKTSHDAGDYQDSAGEVVFGSSLTSATKCVRDPGHVHCDDTAQQKGRTGEYPDTFHIYHEGSQICAHRTDTHAGWGLHLVVQCKTRGSGGGGFGGGSGSHGGNGGREVVIGESPDSQIKCVDSQPGIYCDDTAKQVGRTGQYPDTFHIYQENGQICAKRTDAPAGWGLNLVLHCKTYGPPIGEIYRTAKIRYCCTKHLFSPACPYDCDALDRHASLGWTSKRRSWCCGNRGMGCRANERPPLPQHGGSGPYNCEIPDTTEDHVPLPDQQGGGVHWNPTDEQPRYNCMHGSKEMWSQDKAQYCKLWLAASEAYRKSGQAFKEGLYDCNTGDESSWSSEQIWWCQHHSSSPHECDAKKKDQWDNSERDFCCILKGIGCPKVLAVPIDDHYGPQGDSDRNDWEDAASLDIIDHPNTKPRPAVVHHKLHFDCLSKDNEAWSETKKRWCCSKWGLFCEELGDFNCSVGFWNWKKGWSSDKKDFCCKKEGKACQDKSYDCSQETTAINKKSREWCCENHLYSKACPFDCQAGLDKWMIGFAPAKKSWCCKYEKLACPPHDSFGHGARPPPSFGHGARPPHSFGHGARPPNSFGHGVHHTPARPLHKPHFHEHELDHAHLGESAFSPRYTFDDCQNKDDRSKDCVDWCCRNLGLCYLSVSFNCQVGLSRWHTWSSQKQAVCCGKKVTCSGHGDGGHSSHGGHYSHGGHFSHGGSGHYGGMGGHVEHFDESGSHAWYQSQDLENLHIGTSPTSGTKCVTPSKPVMCPVDAGNRRDDHFPDRFKVYRKGGQLCVDRLDFAHLWGLDLVLKCIKLDPGRFEEVHIGSSPSSVKCVPQRAPVTCDSDAAQAGRTDHHPDTFQVYHSGGQICAKRVDAESHWGLNLVLYCRRGGWDSNFWSSSSSVSRVLEDSYSDDVRDPGQSSPVDRANWPMLAILPVFFAVLMGAFLYSAACKRSRSDGLPLQAEVEDANSSQRKARTPWLSVPAGDEGDELEVA